MTKQTLAEKAKHDYEYLINPLREVAKEHGYALTVHGTLARDIDLVAIPWIEEAKQAHELAEAIMRKIAEMKRMVYFHPIETTDYFLAGCPAYKPHNRLVWCFHLGDGVYVDLSVIPPEGYVFTDLDHAGKIPFCAIYNGEIINKSFEKNPD
jgi:hypothetical protein